MVSNRHEPPPVAFTAVLFALATHRLTRLVTTDEITAGLREPVQTRAETRWSERTGRAIDEDRWQSKAAYLLSCPWCASWHVATALVIGLAATGRRLPHPVLHVLAASTITGLIAGHEES